MQNLYVKTMQHAAQCTGMKYYMNTEQSLAFQTGLPVESWIHIMTHCFTPVRGRLNSRSHHSVQPGIGGGCLLVPISCVSRDPEWVRMTWLFRACAWATSSMVTGCVLKRAARVLRRTLWAPSRGGPGERSSSSILVHRATLAPTLLLVPSLFVLP